MNHNPNYAHSVKARLWNLAATQKRDPKDNQMYQLILLRYIHERLLYRISVSRFNDNFCLKGGVLLFAHELFNARPTVDIDFLGRSISRDTDVIASAFREIIEIGCEEDGLVFDPDSIMAVENMPDREYNGVNISMKVRLDSTITAVSMDIGFGDIITPDAETIDYPILLENLPQPHIKAYSLETVIAEKFETMIYRAQENSRMKDFFDVYVILNSKNIDDNILEEAISGTFSIRKTEVMPNHPIFDDSFATEPFRIQRWNAFLKRMKWPYQLPFQDVMQLISSRLKPIYDKMLQE